MSAWDGVVLRDGTPFALVEVKSRNGEPYEEWHISQSKIDKITSEAKQRNVKFFLIFAWSGVAYVGDVLKFPPLQTHISGRTDRNDPADLEKMYLIPAKFFQKI